MKYIFITSNRNKYLEISKYIPHLKELDYNIPEIQSIDINEIIKAKLLAAKDKIFDLNSVIIVEDTGLYLKALNNFPGPLIKLFFKSLGNKGIYRICNKMNNYEAKAICSFGIYVKRNDEIMFFSSYVKGKISSPRGNYGFGWDEIFVPNGSAKTFAEMKRIEEKNKYSMRYKALKKMLLILNKL